MRNIWTFIKRYKFSLLVVAVILFLSFFKPPHTELDEITNFDKMVHFGMYFVFSGVIWMEYLHSHAHADWRRLAVGAVVLPIVLSGGIELGQEYLTVYRGGDWWDFASNSTGVLVAAVTGYLFLRRRRG